MKLWILSLVFFWLCLINANSQNTFLQNAPNYQITPTYDGSGQSVHPSVIDFLKEHNIPQWNGYRYWMAFTPYPNSNSALENPSLLASHNGVNWVVPAGITNPIVPYPGSPAYLADPDMVYNPDLNEIWLYYRYRNTSIQKDQIRMVRIYSDLSISSSYIVQQNYPFYDSLSFVAPCVWRESSTRWHMWGVILGYPNSFIYAFSNDGINWSQQVNCINPQGQNPFMAAGYRGWHVCCRPNYRENRVEFMMASSLASYTGHPAATYYLVFAQCPMDNPTLVTAPFTQPILRSSTNGWDNKNMYRASFLIEDSLNFYYYRVWYSASSISGRWHIGYTQGKIPSQYSNPDSLQLRAHLSPSDSGKICHGDSLFLQAIANINTGISYQWFFNGDSIAGATTPTYYAKETGFYYCRVKTATRTAFSDTFSLNVKKLPYPFIYPSKPYLCNQDYVILSTDSSYTGYNLIWKKPTITVYDSLSIYANQHGNYTLAITDGTCQLESSFFLQQLFSPFVNLPFYDTTKCPFDTIQVMPLNDISAFNHYWVFNYTDTLYVTGIEATQGGTYSVYVYNFCGTDSASVQINNYHASNITLNYSTNLACDGDSVLLYLTGDVAQLNSILWFKGNTFIASGTDSIYVKTCGVYKAVYEDDCRSFSNTEIIRFNIKPQITPAPYDSVICPGHSVALNNDINTYYRSIVWYHNNTPIENYFSENLITNVPGTYAITASNYCGSDTVLFVLVADTISKPVLYYLNDTLFCFSSAIQYFWYYNDTLIPNETSYFHIPLADGFYKIIIIDSFGCTQISDPINIYLTPINKPDNIYDNEGLLISIAIYDLSGRLVYNSKSSEIPNKQKIQQGIYILKKHYSNGRMDYEKIIIAD